MYCCTNRFWLLLCLLLSAGGFVSAQEQEQPDGSRQISYRSNGTSRFEIEAGNIVVVCWGGVEVGYEGYALTADELRFNQATKYATVAGSVQITGNGLDVSTALVEINAEEGWIRLPQATSGTLADPALAFAAGNAELAFASGLEVSSFADTSVLLAGGVDIRTGEDHVLSSDGFSLDGATGRIKSSGEVSIRLGNQQIQAEDGQQFPGISGAEILASSLSAYLTETGDFSEGLLEGVELTSRDVSISAGSARILPAFDQTTGPAAWLVRLEGSPVTGEIRQEDALGFETLYIGAEVTDTGISSMDLQGGIRLTFADTVMTSEAIALNRRDDGYHVQIPGTLRIDFHLDDVLGGEPLERGSIEQWLSH